MLRKRLLPAVTIGLGALLLCATIFEGSRVPIVSISWPASTLQATANIRIGKGGERGSARNSASAQIRRLRTLQDFRRRHQTMRPCRAAGDTEAGSSPPSEEEGDWRFRLSSFNMLCPPYKRMQSKGAEADKIVRESIYPEEYRERYTGIIEMFGEERSDLFALQEMWVESDDIQEMFQAALKDKLSGYSMLQLKRTSHWSPRDDGLGFLIGPKLNVLDSQEILFQDCGDRVALLLLLVKKQQPLIVVNTHLLFPHHPYSTDIRLREVRKILCFIDVYVKEKGLNNVPVVICGDFNGSPQGAVGSYMQSQGFELLCGPNIAGENGHNEGWVTHRNHKDTNIFCDLIWVLNPSKKSSFQPQDWKDKVFAEIDKKISERNLTLSQSFKMFFDQDSNDLVDSMEFRRAINELGFQGESTAHLLDIEIDELMSSADRDHNGKVDYKEFIDRFWKANSQPELLIGISAAENSLDDADVKFLRGNETQKIQLSQEEAENLLQVVQNSRVNNVALNLEPVEGHIVPKAMERGTWPSDWTLSDHGLVTSTFSLKK